MGTQKTGRTVLATPCGPTGKDKFPMFSDDTPKLKKCTKCGRVKPLPEFYPLRHTKDGLNSQCKDCQKSAHASLHGETLEPSTLLVKHLLEQRGIPSFPGLGAGLRYVDLVAWGCVPIEAKVSQRNRHQGFSWKFSLQQQEQWFDGLIIFVADYSASYRTFIVPAGTGLIRYDKDGNQRASVYADFGPVENRRKNFDPTLPNLLRRYEDRFDLIEQYRQSVSRRLIENYVV